MRKDKREFLASIDTDLLFHACLFAISVFTERIDLHDRLIGVAERRLQIRGVEEIVAPQPFLNFCGTLKQDIEQRWIGEPLALFA